MNKKITETRNLPKVAPAKNSTELAYELAKTDSALTNKQTEQFIEFLFKLIGKSLPYTGKVTINNFGVFAVKHSRPRTRYIPRTGEHREQAAMLRVTFKPSPALKEVLAKNYDVFVKRNTE